ncbi:hypothetical protein [Lacrimispora sp.]|uniref:hypothetical protein n=1 Tax=Lacrimispora sp. TaxID=2719234 RepID=UPI00399398FD
MWYSAVEEKDVSTTYDAVISLKEKMIKHVLNGRWFCSVLDEAYNNKSLWDDGES